MKKLLLFVLLLLPIAASAQGWRIMEIKGDELKGTLDHMGYYYLTEDANLFYYASDDKETFLIKTGEGIFDYDDNYVSALVGYYRNGTLEKKQTVSLFVSMGNANSALGTPAVAKPIIEYLETGGDVRFIIGRYGRASLDITVTHRE